MKRIVARVAVAAIAIAPLTVTAAEAATATPPGVTVTFKDASGAPLGGVGLQVWDNSSGTLQPATGGWNSYSDPNGTIAFSGATIGADLIVCADDNVYDTKGQGLPAARTTRYAYQCWNNTTAGSPTAAGGTAIPITSATQNTAISMTLVSAGKSLTPDEPWVTGSYAVGQQLTAHPGTWGQPGVSLSYQWYNGVPSMGGTPISGATGPTYTPTAADDKNTVVVAVTGSLAGYASATVDSAFDGSEGYVSGATATDSSLSIKGDLVQGQTLTAVDGTLSPANGGNVPDHFWYVNGHIAAGYTNTFPLTAAYVGKSITLVSEYNDGYAVNAAIQMTSATGVVVSNALTATTPSISGTRVVGSRLTAVPGTWGPAPVTLHYQWYRSGAVIAGATASSYLLGTADFGKAITVKVTGTKAEYVTAARISASSGTILGHLAVGWPAISGTSRVGSVLAAHTGTWGPAPVGFTFQWYRVNPTTGALVPITGATGSSFRLTSAQHGYRVRVRVIGHKAGYAAAWRDSANTATIG